MKTILTTLAITLLTLLSTGCSKDTFEVEELPTEITFVVDHSWEDATAPCGLGKAFYNIEVTDINEIVLFSEVGEIENGREIKNLTVPNGVTIRMSIRVVNDNDFGRIKLMDANLLPLTQVSVKGPMANDMFQILVFRI